MICLVIGYKIIKLLFVLVINTATDLSLFCKQIRELNL